MFEMKQNNMRETKESRREKALKLHPIGKEIMLNSVQRRLDNRTIILERKK